MYIYRYIINTSVLRSDTVTIEVIHAAKIKVNVI